MKVSQITKLLNCNNKYAKELIINIKNNFNYYCLIYSIHYINENGKNFIKFIKEDELKQ